jgi:ComF family protein
MKLATLLDVTLQILYPPRCAACDVPCSERAPFCEVCALTLEAIVCACERCGLPLPSPATCGACLRRAPPWRRALAPLEFGGALATAVRRLKWAGMPELAPQLAQLVPPALLPHFDLIVPVPLHPKRLRAREYNQAALLALELSDRVDLHALDRIRDTPPQSALDADQRRRNVRDAFRARPARVRDRSVLLVDDVMTTGATAGECTRALLDAGAATVDILTVGRAVP